MIIVMKRSETNNAVPFINGSAEFQRHGNKNELAYTNHATILGAFATRAVAHHHQTIVKEAVASVMTSGPLLTSGEGRPGSPRRHGLNAEIARIVALQKRSA